MNQPNHKSGFVNIIGRPNVGKSTLMNALVGERMSIITNKPQTTRHRLMGILSHDDYQIVFSDTPGMVGQPAYKMHEIMNKYVASTFEDADLMLFVTEATEQYAADDPLIRQLQHLDVPKLLALNKTDITDREKLLTLTKWWNDLIPFVETIPVSALQKQNTDLLLERIIHFLPEGPAYYPKDQLTDRPERFFVAEIIREKILLLYEQEIPYSCEVVIEDFKDTETTRGEPLARISATIFVNRKTQKPILIGKNGQSIKQLGSEARKDIEIFLDRKAFLEIHVKIKENWRNDERTLRQLGFQ